MPFETNNFDFSVADENRKRGNYDRIERSNDMKNRFYFFYIIV